MKLLTELGTTHEVVGVISGQAKLRFGQSDQETSGGLELDLSLETFLYCLLEFFIVLSLILQTLKW